VRRYHHLGIPTTEQKPGETHLEKGKMYASGYWKSPYRIEWIRFDDRCELPELVKTCRVWPLKWTTLRRKSRTNT